MITQTEAHRQTHTHTLSHTHKHTHIQTHTQHIQSDEYITFLAEVTRT